MTISRRNSPRVFYARVVAVVIAGAVAGLAFVVLLPVWRPLAWALLLAALLRPAQRHLSARCGNRAGVAAGLLTLLTFIVVVGPISGLVASFGAEVAELAEQVQARSDNDPGLARLPELRDVPIAGASLEGLRRYFGVSRTLAREWIASGFRSMIAVLGPLSGKLVLGAFGTAVAFPIMLVILFFSLRDGDQLLTRAGDLIPWPRPMKRHLIEHLDGVLRAVLFGTWVTATIQGVLVGIAFAVLDLPGPIVFGALAGLLAIVPLGGTALIWGPAAIFLAVQDRWWAAAGLVLWGMLLVGTVDNILRPALVSGRAEVGTLTIFIGVIGGLAAFGVVGLVLGPLILCLLFALLELLTKRPNAA